MTQQPDFQKYSIYAILSTNAYMYKEAQPEFTYEGKVYKLRIVDPDFVVYRNDKDKVFYMAVRGTDFSFRDLNTPRDLLDDANVVQNTTTYTPRFRKINRVVKYVIEAANNMGGYEVHLTGHSLGGRLAIDLMRSNLEDIDFAVLYSPGTSIGQMLSSLGSHTRCRLGSRKSCKKINLFNEKVRMFYNKRDPISFLSRFEGGQRITSDSPNPHGLHQFTVKEEETE